MAVSDKVRKAEELWSLWDVRVLVLLSLFIQVILTFLAPLRKRSASGPLKLTLWLLYLSASGIALYVISQITGNRKHSPATVDLLAFWAPFLLLHLGGPDTITALALEDNELWHRHALELITQFGVTLYVFINLVCRRKSPILGPTAFMFVDGFIKYMERTQALYYASIESFRESLDTEPEPVPDYLRLMDVYNSSIKAHIPVDIHGRDDQVEEEAENANNTTVEVTNETIPSNDPIEGNNNSFKIEDTDEMIVDAYEYYTKFKGLLADNFLSLKVRKESRDFFMNKPGIETYRIIQIELNLIYDIFYTKGFLIESKQVYLRAISYIAVITSLVWFSLLHKRLKSGDYNKVDIVVTYILLVGALALDMCGLLMLILSDWYVIINNRCKGWPKKLSTTLIVLFKWLRSPNSNRWSRSISKYNLLKRYCKDPPSIYTIAFIGRIKDAIIGFLYVESGQFKDGLIVKFIVDELQKKAKLVKDDDLKAIKDVCSARGDLMLENDRSCISEYLQPWTTDIDFDESLITWHIATDICYHTRDFEDGDEGMSKINLAVEMSKNLSDYMSYLLFRQQTLVSSVVGMSDKRSIDTRAEAQKALMQKRLATWSSDSWTKIKYLWYKLTCQEDKKNEVKKKAEEKEKAFLKEFCHQLLDVNVEVRRIVAKGDESRSVVLAACHLAKQLKMFGTERQWETMSKVWMEMLCYTAARCTPRAHVAQLNKGGELVTLVWLLMAHLGFGERFLKNQGLGWSKLIIHK